MTIYAVTKGEYSDYHICALTVNKEKAQHLQKLFSDKWDDANIEEYEDGEGFEYVVPYFCDANGKSPKLCDFHPNVKGVVEDPYTKVVLGVYVYAKDEAHAEKTAQDMIAEYKARKAGIV